jgi:Flp/Fap pilin component
LESKTLGSVSGSLRRDAQTPMFIGTENQKRIFGRGFQHERIMSKFPADFLSDESGATAIEYGLIAAGIAIVIIGAVNLWSVPL